MLAKASEKQRVQQFWTTIAAIGTKPACFSIDSSILPAKKRFVVDGSVDDPALTFESERFLVRFT
jgi:hypothetical protein